jgi:hypothetical protein
MIRYGLVCLLLTALLGGPSALSQDSGKPGASAAPGSDQGHLPYGGAIVAPDAPVITIAGLCAGLPVGQTDAGSCKTVLSRAEFEKVADLLMPNPAPEARRYFARKFANSLVGAGRALEMGLEKTPNFSARIEVNRMNLGRAAIEQKFSQEAWAKVTDKEIEDYYHDHPGEFEQVDVDRVFVPKMPRQQDKDLKLSEAEQQKRQAEWFEELRQAAEKYRVRAVAGEDFLKLQSEAYKIAGLQETDVDPSMIALLGIRRKMFSAGQRPVMEVKTGEISPVLTDQNGYSIFRVKGRSTMPLEKVKGEIHNILRDQGVEHDWEALKGAATTTYNNDYFGPETDEDRAASGSGQATPESHP